MDEIVKIIEEYKSRRVKANLKYWNLQPFTDFKGHNDKEGYEVATKEWKRERAICDEVLYILMGLIKERTAYYADEDDDYAFEDEE